MAECGSGLSTLDCFLPTAHSTTVAESISVVGSETSTTVWDNRSARPPSPPVSPPKVTRRWQSPHTEPDSSSFSSSADNNTEQQPFLAAQPVAIVPVPTPPTPTTNLDSNTYNNNNQDEYDNGEAAALQKQDPSLWSRQLMLQKFPSHQPQQQSVEEEEALSTASEMGTVVHLQEDLLLLEIPSQDGTVSTHYETPRQQQPLMAVEDGLSLPLLEEQQQETENNHKQQQQHSPNNHNNNDACPQTPSQQPPATRYTMADNNNNGLLQNLRRWTGSSSSAPTTPQNHHPPRSFLLRSPGSSAFQQAQQNIHHQALLPPRFRSHQNTKKKSSSPLRRPHFSLARSCFSFDTTTTDDDPLPPHLYPSSHLFRPKPQPQQHDRSRKNNNNNHPCAAPPKQPAASWDGPVLQRLDANSRLDAWQSNNIRQKNNQVVDIQREDALDILACLVERGVSLHSSSVDDSCGEEEETHVPTTTTTTEQSSPPNLDQLRRSHEYALEMQRASRSAASWLESIGRTAKKKNSKSFTSLTEETTEQVSDEEDHFDNPNDNDNATGEEQQQQQGFEHGTQQAAGEESCASEAIDLLTTKALLHAAQAELKERQKKFDVLNEELAQCRAEIGRLKTTQSSFRSPNRSILDESDDVSATEEQAEVEVIEKLDSQFLDDFEVESSFINEPNEKVQKYQSRLDEANDVIRTLHCELGRDTESAPVVVFDEGTPPRPSPSNKEFDTINVRMLDGENFVTDWHVMDLTSPPDHDLESPIVRSILEAWTRDRNLHESLLVWVEQVLSGNDPDTIPPLSVSNLDHRVRDGFSLHILPLLLRRKDIVVDVRTRAHRTTVYDVSVSVDRNVPGCVQRQPLDHKPPSDVVSAVNSSASTTLMSNATFVYEKPPLQVATSRLSYDEVSEDIQSPDEHLQPGLMSALGGAFSGLLTRRHNMQTIAESPQSLAGLEDPPYHRVVSAPPGRIGVTFVEYRGHCMVSDVSPHSNLMGWIFPSDVLIAIDELPVSGMRIRDIIQVLKDRNERQRALRVISSHAMNELTFGDDSSK